MKTSNSLQPLPRVAQPLRGSFPQIPNPTDNPRPRPHQTSASSPTRSLVSPRPSASQISLDSQISGLLPPSDFHVPTSHFPLPPLAEANRHRLELDIFSNIDVDLIASRQVTAPSNPPTLLEWSQQPHIQPWIAAPHSSPANPTERLNSSNPSPHRPRPNPLHRRLATPPKNSKCTAVNSTCKLAHAILRGSRVFKRKHATVRPARPTIYLHPATRTVVSSNHSPPPSSTATTDNFATLHQNAHLDPPRRH